MLFFPCIKHISPAASCIKKFITRSSDRALLDSALLMAHEEKGVHWLGPLSVDCSLWQVLTSVTNEELDKHPLDYRPVSQPKDETLRYDGVLREATIELGVDTFHLRVSSAA
jgi:hypothetical protein